MNRSERRRADRKQPVSSIPKKKKRPMPFLLRWLVVALGVLIIFVSVGLAALGKADGGQFLGYTLLIGGAMIFVALEGRF